MSKEKFDRLLKKYWNAESSLQEEEQLFDAVGQNTGMQAWFTYAKEKRKQVPGDLKDSIWASIHSRKKKRQRFLYVLSGIAASVILFIILYTENTNNKHASYVQKEALLKEALSMFSDKKPIPAAQNIIYEDEMIIIYKASR